MTTPALIAASAFEMSDLAIIFATIAGPVLAVQIQKLLERRRSIDDRRNQVFRTLMATRAAVLSQEHVQALNAVPVEFYGTGGKLKAINEKWKEFLDHHAPDLQVNESWIQKRTDLFVDLLYLISQSLGYDFSRSQLARDVWSPQAHGELETEQNIIRKGFVKLFNGELALPMAVTEFPATADDASLANQEALQKLLLEWLEGQRAVKVEQQQPDQGGTAE